MKGAIGTFISILMMNITFSSSANEVIVAVAANFTDATREIVSLFEKDTGYTVKISFGSTGKLYSQIENGAPFDVFLAADSARPLKAEKEGLALAGSRFTYAKGRLVFWSARADTFTDAKNYIRDAAFTRIAIANPKTAPYGLAAQQVLERLHVWNELGNRIVRSDSIAQTFQFVATGNVDAGFVALSQVKAWKGERGNLWYIPSVYYDLIAQQAVLLRRGENNTTAIHFFQFLKSEKVRKVIESYGYGVDE